MQERIQYLFKKFLNNTCSKEEFEEIFAFIKMAESDNEIRALLDATLAVYETANTDPEKANVFVNRSGEIEALLNDPLRLPRQRKRGSRKLIWYSAAACTCIMAFMLWVNNGGNAKNRTGEIVRASIKQATEKSQYRHLLLPDSTEVWLNAASELEFPEKFGNDKREVLLTGEAFFDVKHADKIPFIIYTGKVSTVVLGTAFNIKAYPDMDKITVSVKRGRVQVKYVDKPVAMLGIGEQVSIAVNDSTVKEKKLDEIEVSAWQQGKLVYDDYTVEDITKDLERVFNSKIQVKNDTIRDLRVSTSFDKETGLEKALEILCRLTDTKLIKENNIYYIK